MAGNEAKIQVTADIKQAERQLDKLTKQVEDLQRKGGLKFELFGSGAGLKNNLPAAIKRTGEAFGFSAKHASGLHVALAKLDSQFKNGAIRAGVGGLGLALAKFSAVSAPTTKAVGTLATALSGLVAKGTGLVSSWGAVGAAIGGTGAAFDAVTKGVVGTNNVVQQMLLHLKDLPNSWGLAAVAAMAFAPAAITAGKAINNAVGTQATKKIAELTSGIENAVTATQKLEGSVIDAGDAFRQLLEGSSLNQLNKQLADATKQSGAFAHSTVEAWEAAQQLVTAMRLQKAEQAAINDLVRKAQGLQPQDVRDAESARRKADLISGRNAQKRDAEAAATAQSELAALRAKEAAESAAARERLKGAAAARTLVELAKQEAELAKQNLEVRYNWLKVLREGQAATAARQSRLQGANYGLGQVPAGGQLFPGGNTRTAQEGYRQMLNAQALTKQAAADALQKTQARTVLEGKSVEVLRTRVKALNEQAAIDARSVEILRQQNAERIKAEQLDARALTVARRQVQLADLKNKKKKGEEMQKRVENTLVSGAFPLLFGAGPAATIGGFAGGAMGGTNPMIGVFTSAIGQIFDTIRQNLTDLGKSLREPTSALQAMETAGLRVSDPLRTTVTRLSEVGRSYEAQAAIFASIKQQLGSDGLQALFGLIQEQKRLEESWSKLTSVLTSELLPALVGATSLFADLTGGLASLASIQLPDWLKGLIKRGEAAVNPFAALSLGLSDYGQGATRDARAPGLTPEVLQKDADVRLAESRRQADEIKSAYREGFALQQKAHDLERQGIQLRRQFEDEIFNRQQQVLRGQIEADRQRKQIAIEMVDLEYRRRVSNEEGRAAQVLEAEAALMRTRAQNEADIAAKKRTLELDIAKQQRDTQNYIFNVNQQIDSLRRATLQYEMDVADYRLKIARQIQDQERITAAASGAGGVPTSGVVARTGNTGQSTDPHLDARWADGRPITASQVDKYILAGGRTPSSYGVTSPYGPRNLFGRTFHAGIDFGTPSGTPITLTGGATFAGNLGNTGNGGIAISVMTPEGMMRLLHLSQGAVGISGQGAVAPQLRNATNNIRPTVAPVSGGVPSGQLQALDAADAKIKSEQVKLQERLNQLGEEGALQRVLEVARGAKELEQRRTNIAVLTATLGIQAAASEQEEERLRFEAESAVKLRERQEVDARILKTSKLQGEERKKLEQALKEGLEITRQQIELDRVALQLAQEQAYVAEKMAAQRKLGTAGAGLKAGFIGGAASTYESALGKYGDANKAAELARLQQATDLATMKAQALESAYMGVGGAISSAMTQGVADLMTGAKTAQEVFADMLKGIGDALISAAQQMIATYIAIGIAKMFAGMGGGSSVVPGKDVPIAQMPAGMGFASGGSPTPGQPTIVGERGPELFVPGQSGGITNNQNLRSMMASNNIKTTGRDNAPVLNMTFETTKFMDRDWVDREQLEAAMAQSAKKGAADGERRAMDRLRQSPRTRRSLGL